MHIVVHVVCAVVIVVLLAVVGSDRGELVGLRARLAGERDRVEKAERRYAELEDRIERGIESRNDRIAADAERIEKLQDELARRSDPEALAERWRSERAAYREVLAHCALFADWEYVERQAAAGKVREVVKTGEQEAFVHLANGFRVNVTLPPDVDAASLAARVATPRSP